MSLRLDDDDDEAEQKARMGIERRTERELRRSLDDMLNTLFPQGYGEFVDPQIEQARIHQAFLAEQQLRDTISRAIQDSADLGVSVAVKQFENVGFGFDYTLANETARAWALRYTDEVLAQLGTTTARIVGQSVGRWIGNGEPLQALVNDLRPAFGKQRARLIASTEVTRAYAQGTKEAYTASGVVKKLVWQASMDERVCIYCGSLHGKVVGIEENFDGALPANLRERARPFALPPAHPGCRCWISAQIDEPRPAGTRQRKPKPSRVSSPQQDVTDLQEQLSNVFRDYRIAKETGDTAAMDRLRAESARLKEQIAQAEAQRQAAQAALSQRTEPRTAEAARQALADAEKRMAERDNELLELRRRLNAVAPQINAAMDARDYDAFDRLVAEREPLKARLAQLEAAVQDDFRRYVYVESPSNTKVTAPSALAPNWQSGLDEFNKMVSSSLWEGKTIQIKAPDGSREYADVAGKAIYVHDRTHTSIVVHELGHILESNPDTLRKVLEFYDRRTAGDALEPLNRFRSYYQADEQTRVDRWLDPYVGKDYERRSTEVVAMGIQWMYEKPAEFARRDPDMFDFIFNLLRGR